MSEIRDYQVDHLLLLVGSNPVPNAVAGKLLNAPGGTITLIHSPDSFQLAQRLESWFKKSSIKADFKEVQASDANIVAASVQQVLKDDANDAGNIHRPVRSGLNYTGGTKVMAVHAYRALEQWSTNHSGFTGGLVFSYLDASTLRMCFEGTPSASFYVGRDVEISIDELLELHDWKPVKDPITVPVLPESAKALLAVLSNPTEARIWTDWLRNEFSRNARKPESIDPPVWVFQSGKELQGQYDVKQPALNDNWKSNTKLRELTISWPNLPHLRETMSNELGQSDAGYLDLKAAKGRGCKDEEDFCEWLNGTWLESVVLSALQQCSHELHLADCCMDLKPRALDSSAGKALFQFDVVAIRGYQLFAFSCTTEDGSKRGGRGLLKQKLFEASIRAQQMGGDEACVALVCCMSQEEANNLQEEMHRDISPEGRIRVFGRECLGSLSENIAGWVRQQSKEV